MTPILIVPGWQNSEAGHWQTLWEKKLGAARVIQDDWMNPRREDWVARLQAVVNQQSVPPILITHSMGTITAVILSAETKCKVAGAFLVAPVDLELPETPREIAGFLPTPLKPLRFPSLVVASRNDPYCSIERADFLARQWGSRFVDLGPKGHINVAAGFGAWESGIEIFSEFSKGL